MKKLFGKALAMAVMMSVFAGGSAYADHAYIDNGIGGLFVDGADNTEPEALLIKDALYFYPGGTPSSNASYGLHGLKIGDIKLDDTNGLNMGNLDITGVKNLTVTGTLNATVEGYVEKGTTNTTDMASIAVGSDAKANGHYAIAVGMSTANGVSSVAIGGTTEKDYSTALGRNAKTFKENDVAVGYRSATGAANATAIGYQASVYDTATNSVAIGANSEAYEANTVSIGTEGAERKIVNVAAGENDTDAVNYSQIKADDGNYVKAAQTVAENFTALDDQVKTNAGDISTLKSDMTTAKSDISTLQSDMTTAKSDISTLQSDMTTAQGDISTLQSDMTTAKSDISTLQSDMTTAKSDISTLQGDMTTAKSDISTLQSDMTTAQGDISTLQTDVGALDTRVTAVEGFAGDISALQSDVATNKTDISNLKSDVATNKTDISNLKSDVAKKADKTDLTAEETARKDADANLQNQIDALGGGSLELNNRINATNDRVDRVGATAAALAGIHYQPMAKGQSQVAVGMGGYKGKKATALGLAYQFNDRVSGSVAGAANGSEHMFNVGFNYLFGQHTAKDVAQCAVTPGSMSLKEAEMQATIDSQGAKITTLESEVAELKAMVKALAAK